MSSKERTVVLNYSKSTVHNALDSIFRESSWCRIVKNDDSFFELKTNASMKSYGESITISLEAEKENQVSITIVSKMKMQLVDYGINAKNIDKILDQLNEHLSSKSFCEEDVNKTYVVDSANEVPLNSKEEIKQINNPYENKTYKSNKSKTSLIKKLWNNNPLMIFITIDLFVLFAIIFLDSLTEYLCGMIAGVVLSLIIGPYTVKKILPNIGKILFVAFIVGLILTLICVSIPSSSNNIDNSKCVSCNGSGKVNNGFWDWHTCPTCNGTGIPPL